MWKATTLATLIALLAPAIACAQQLPPNGGDGGPPPGGPSPEVRAKIDAARAAARKEAFAALGDDHRAKVQAVVDAFDADGSTLTTTAAATQIDAILTPAETQTARDEQQQFRSAMRAAFDGNGAGPGPGRRGPAPRTPDAGRFLLSIDADQAAYRAAMRAERANGEGPPGGGPPPR